MKTIHHINATVYSIFFVLFIIETFYKNQTSFIILGYISLGVLQPILGLILLTYQNSISKQKKKLLAIYWLLVFSFFTVITIFGASHFNSKMTIAFLSALPALIATYFVYVTYSIKLK